MIQHVIGITILFLLFLTCVFLPTCAYQNFYLRSTFLASGYSSSLCLPTDSPFFGLHTHLYTPCVLGTSQPLCIPLEPLIQCPELPHAPIPIIPPSTLYFLISRMPLACLPTRLALIGHLQQWRSALPYLVPILLFLMYCLLG